MNRYVCTLTADDEAEFVHHCTASNEQAAAKFTANVWLLGHPERRSAQGIRVTCKEAAQ